MAKLSLRMSDFVVLGIKAMPLNQNTFIDRYSFNRFILLDTTECSCFTTISELGFRCQTDYVHTKNPNLSKFWRALEWKMLEYFYGHFEYVYAIWYFAIFSSFGMLHQEKSLQSLRMRIYPKN
jgi:hypothetical protein